MKKKEVPNKQIDKIALEKRREQAEIYFNDFLSLDEINQNLDEAKK